MYLPKKKGIILIWFLMLTGGVLFAESSLGLDMQLFQNFYRGSDNRIYGLGSGNVGLTFRSTGNADVKGDFQLGYNPINLSISGVSVSAVDLTKASIKLRFPGLRLTLGKTRVGWGEGFVFNSGDVLFGSLSPLVDLTGDAARNDTAWLVLGRWSPGGRTYLEGIYMPPAPQVDLSGPFVTYSIQPIDYSSGGGRLVTEIADMTLEAGYLYKAEAKTTGDVLGHRPYITLHGDLFFDLYASASIAIPTEDPQWDQFRGSLNISGGLFRQFQLWYDGVLSARLEFIIFPYQHWDEMPNRLNPAGTDIYGLFLYPELNLAVGQNWNIPVMAVISPIDQSAQITGGFSWKVYQGFSFLGYGIFSIGDKRDIFSWDRKDEVGPYDQINGWSSMVGMRYSF